MSEVLVLMRPDKKPVYVVKAAIVEWYKSDTDARLTHINLIDGKFREVLETVEEVSNSYASPR